MMFSFLKPLTLKLLSNLVYFSLMLETLQASLSVPCKRVPFCERGAIFEFEFCVANLNLVL